MPQTTSTYSITGICPVENPQDARAGAVKIKASQTIARGTMLAVNTITRLHEAYSSGGSNGVGVATCICMYSIITDSNGLVYFGNSSTASEINVASATAPVWTAGTFAVADLIGYVGSESDVQGDMSAHLTPNGHLCIPG